MDWSRTSIFCRRLERSGIHASATHFQILEPMIYRVGDPDIKPYIRIKMMQSTACEHSQHLRRMGQTSMFTSRPSSAFNPIVFSSLLKNYLFTLLNIFDDFTVILDWLFISR